METRDFIEKERFVTNSFWNALVMIITKFGGIIFVVLLARSLLPEKFGLYNLALAISIFIVSIINTAMNQTTSRYLSEAIQKKDKKLANAYFNYIKKIKLWIYTIIALLSLILAYPLSIYIFQKQELFIPLIFFSLYIFLLPIQTFYEFVFYALKKVKNLTIKELLLQSTKIIICFSLFLIFGASIPLAIISVILSSIFASIFLKDSLIKEAPQLFNKAENLIEKKRITLFIKKSTVSSFFNSIAENFDILFLGFFVSSIYIGYFSASLVLVGGFLGILGLANISLPFFTNNNELETTKMIKSLFRYFSIISTPLIIGIFVFGKYFLKFLYGDSYLEATVILSILSIMLFEFPLSELLKSFLLSKEKPEVIGKAILLSLIVDISLNILFLILFFGKSMLLSTIFVSGVLVFSRLIALFYLFFYIRKNFRINYNLKFLLLPLISSLLSIIPFYLIDYYIEDMTIPRGIIEILISIIFYLIIMILSKEIKKEDFLLIKKFLNFK